MAAGLQALLQHPVLARFARPLTFEVASAFAVRVAGMASALVLYLVLARGLPVAQFGVYALVLGWLNLLAMVATLGTDVAALRFLPEYRVREQPGRARAFVRFAARAALLTGVPLALAAILVVHLRFGADTARVATVMLAATPLIALIAQRQSILRSSGSVIAALLPEQVLRPLAAAAFALLAAWLWPPLSAFAAGAALLLATVVSYLVGNALLARASLPWRGAALPVAGAQQAHEGALWLRTALRLGVFGWGYALLRQLDLLLVGALLDAERAAHYAVALRCADIALFVALAVDVLVAPSVAARHAEGDPAQLALTIRQSGRLAAALSVPVSLLLALVAPFLLPLFGAAYRAGLPAFLVLVAGHTLAASCGYGHYLLTMTGREGKALWVLGGALLVCASLCVLLVPSLQLVGAAIACAAGSLTWRLGSTWWAWRELGVNALPFGPAVRR